MMTYPSSGMSPDYVIDSSVSAAGMVNYDDFLHYMSNFNWSGDHEADLASLIAAGVDPFQYLLNNLNRSAMDFPDWLSYLNTTSSDEEVTDYIWEAGKIIRIPLYSIIFLLGITGNGLVILTILQNSRMRTVTNLFLLNLAISDLLLGVFCIPFTLVGALLRDFVFGAVFCKLIPFLQGVSVSVSGWTLVAISVERFYAIRHPLTSRRWQTRSHARFIILVVWLASLTIMSPVAVLSRLKPAGSDGRRKCREVWPDETLEKIFTVFLDTTLFIIPLLLMGVMYSLVVDHLLKVDQAILHAGGGEGEASGSRTNAPSNQLVAISQSTSGTGQQQRRRTTVIYRSSSKKSTVSNASQLRRCNPEHCLRTKRRILKMLIVVVLEFFICWTPLYVVNTLSLFAPEALYEGLGHTGIALLQLLAQASCCCNPITYCFMSSSFRRAFVNVSGKCSSSKKGRHSSTRTNCAV